MLNLSPIGKIMIVGLNIRRNFDASWFCNPRLEIIDARIREISKMKTIPVGVEYVLTTRFITHSMEQKLKSIPRDGRNIVFRPVARIQDIKRLVAESGILDIAYQKSNNGEGPGLDINDPIFGQVEKAPVVVPTSSVLNEVVEASQEEVGGERILEVNPTIVQKGPPPRGWLVAFIKEKADFGYQGVATDHFDNLVETAPYKTTRSSVSATYYNILRERKKIGASNSERPEQETVKPEVVQERDKIGEATEVLRQFTENSTLVAVVLQELLDENSRLRAQILEMKTLEDENAALKAKLEQIRKSLQL